MALVPTPPCFVLFTDLDGTLLDTATYRCDAARPALDRLREHMIPLVICTSKTRAEVEPLRQELDNHDPFIIENGGALYIPEGYFKTPPAGSISRNGYHVVELGVAYSLLREALRSIEGQTGATLVGFGDMTLEDIVRVTGLAQPEAERARQREYDEPFVVTSNNATLEKVRGAAAQLGLTVVSGGQLYHLVGSTDKGRACRVLTDLYRQEWGEIATAGIGDSLNDMPMLECVDRPFLVERPEGGHEDGIVIEGVTRLRGIGPVGWAEGIRQLLVENS